MDQQIFDQLDRLERGTHISNPSRNTYRNDSSARYSAYDVPMQRYGGEQHGYGGWQCDEFELPPEPMAHDSFGMCIVLFDGESWSDDLQMSKSFASQTSGPGMHKLHLVERGFHCRLSWTAM